MRSQDKSRANVQTSIAVMTFFVIPFAIAAAGLTLSILALVQPGTQGVPGADGIAGVDGAVGADGANGTAGADGVNGTAGADGVNGTMGGAPLMAEFYISTPTATVFPDAATWTKVAGTTTNSVVHASFSHSNNRLTYTGTVNILAHGFASFSYSTNINNQILHIATAKNGVVITASIIQRKTGVGGDVGSSALHYMCTLAENDYIEVFALYTDWNTDTDLALFEHMNFGLDAPSQEYVGTIP